MIEKKLPRHVAFIMDGNGRWAKQRNKPRSFGHKAGYGAMESIVRYAFNRGVEVLSFYVFSTENRSRPEDEIKKLMTLMKRALKSVAPKLVKNRIRFVISGDYSMLKPEVVRAIDELVDDTSYFTEHTLNVCFNYGARTEIVRAVNRIIAGGITEVDEKTFSSYLYTSSLPDPDLIIRTSGEQRLSNFLLWQSAYSELYFTDVFWPDFNGNDLDKAIEWYMGRDRRYGKTE